MSQMFQHGVCGHQCECGENCLLWGRTKVETKHHRFYVFLLKKYFMSDTWTNCIVQSPIPDVFKIPSAAS